MQISIYQSIFLSTTGKYQDSSCRESSGRCHRKCQEGSVACCKSSHRNQVQSHSGDHTGKIERRKGISEKGDTQWKKRERERETLKASEKEGF